MLCSNLIKHYGISQDRCNADDPMAEKDPFTMHRVANKYTLRTTNFLLIPSLDHHSSPRLFAALLASLRSVRA